MGWGQGTEESRLGKAECLRAFAEVGTLKTETGFVAWLQLSEEKIMAYSISPLPGQPVPGCVASTAEVSGSLPGATGPWRGFCQSGPKRELIRAM